MKYSVIIPSYNSLRSIELCIKSIIEAGSILGKIEYELILVDDGSTDNSSMLIDSTAELFLNGFQSEERHNSIMPSIIVAHQVNKGVSSARNIGIEMSTGEYILFVDSDDCVLPDYFEKIETVLNDYNYDLVVFSLRVNGKDRKFVNNSFASKENDEIASVLGELICHNNINTPCARAYKRRIIRDNNCYFPPECSIAEDWTFNLLYSFCISSLYADSHAIYNVMNDNNLSLSRKKKNISYIRIQTNRAHCIVSEELKNCNLEDSYKSILEEAINYGLYKSIFSNAKWRIQNGECRRDIVKNIKRECSEIKQKGLTFPHSKRGLLVCLPVKFRLYWLIYFVSSTLAKR